MIPRCGHTIDSGVISEVFPELRADGEISCPLWFETKCDKVTDKVITVWNGKGAVRSIE